MSDGRGGRERARARARGGRAGGVQGISGGGVGLLACALPLTAGTTSVTTSPTASRTSSSSCGSYANDATQRSAAGTYAARELAAMAPYTELRTSAGMLCVCFLMNRLHAEALSPSTTVATSTWGTPVTCGSRRRRFWRGPRSEGGGGVTEATARAQCGGSGLWVHIYTPGTGPSGPARPAAAAPEPAAGGVERRISVEAPASPRYQGGGPPWQSRR